MSAEPTPPVPSADTGPYETIHLGGQAAAVVPMADFARWRALKHRAEEAEATVGELLDALEDTGVTGGLSDEQVQRLLGVLGARPARRPGETYLTTEEVRQQLGLPR
ncbi:MAG: hypothetical protein JO132_14715 [Streptosporangiaceae bacterium]|nr:hypothetical protein [Streptosporangiaceae bacterium]